MVRSWMSFKTDGAIQKRARNRFRALLLENLERRELLAADLLSLKSQTLDSAALVVDSPKAQPSGELLGLVEQSQADILNSPQSDFAAAWRDFDARNAISRGKLDSSSVVQLREFSNDPTVLQQQLLNQQQLSTVVSTSPITSLESLRSLGANENTVAVTSQTHTLVDSSSIGWFCNTDGSSGTAVSDSPTMEAEGEESGEEGSDGEGSDGFPEIPVIALPQFELAGTSSDLDSYSPSSGTSGRNVELQGAFTEDTSAASDMTLPGINSVHIVDANWIDAQHWSISETLVMSFNVSETVDAPQLDGDSNSSGEDPEGDGTSNSGNQAESSTTLLTVTRLGFVVMTFHAERGLSTVVEAGVKWSQSVSFRDAILLKIESQGSTTVSPLAEPTPDSEPEPDPEGGSPEEGGPGDDGGGGGYNEDDYYGASNPSPPADFSGTSTYSSGVVLTVWTAGSISISATPSLIIANGVTQREQDVAYADDIDVGTSLRLHGNWESSSSSGNLSDPPASTGLPGVPEAVTSALEAAGSGSESNGSGNGNGSADAAPFVMPAGGTLPFPANGDPAWGDNPGDFNPLGSPQGRGHQSTNAGGFNTNLSSSNTGGLTFAAKIRDNDQLTSLSGSLRDGFQREYGDQLNDNDIFVYSDGGADAGSTWSGTLLVGKNVTQQVAVDGGLSKEFALSLGSDDTPQINPAVNTERLNVNTVDRVASIEKLSITAETLVTFAPGEFSYTLDSLVESNGQSRDDTATANAEVGVESEEAGLDRVWNNSSFDLRETVTASVFQNNFNDTHRDYANRERLFWSVLYNSNADMVLSPDGSTNVDSSGEPHSETKETINYSSYTKDIGRSLNSLNNGEFYNTDYLRRSTFEQVLTSTDGGTAVASGDTQVAVSGYDYWEHSDTDGFYEWARIDLATGANTWDGSGDGHDEGPDWDMRTPYEHWLDGSGVEPAPDSEPEDDGELPEEGNYPSNPNAGDGTWIAWFAGQRGDSLDKGIDFAAGFADNVTMNASWAFRSQIVGIDTTDYNNGYYSGGQWVGFAAQLPGTAVAGVKTAVTGVKSLVAAANSVDDVGRCANLLTRLVQGGCFVPGTLVTLSELPRTAPLDEALWTTDNWQNDFGGELPYAEEESYQSSESVTATLARLQLPIEDVPLGARVPTKNPKPWEYDDSLPEPDQETWAKISITVERTDGGVVDAELIRPCSWIEGNGLQAGQMLPLNIEELQVQGLARVNSITPAPRIASGEGSTVTGRFVTRQVDIIARIEVLGADGQVETTEGTTIHPIWSLDRNDWAPLGELVESEQLLGSAGPAVILTHAILQRSTSVYNIEVHGEHVYEAGRTAVLVHNTCEVVLQNGELAMGFMTNSSKLMGRMSTSLKGGHEALADTIQNAAALARSGQAFGFTVAKNSQGITTVFGSGAFPHVAGAIPQHLKNIILGLVG